MNTTNNLSPQSLRPIKWSLYQKALFQIREAASLYFRRKAMNQLYGSALRSIARDLRRYAAGLPFDRQKVIDTLLEFQIRLLGMTEEQWRLIDRPPVTAEMIPAMVARFELTSPYEFQTLGRSWPVRFWRLACGYWRYWTGRTLGRNPLPPREELLSLGATGLRVLEKRLFESETLEDVNRINSRAESLHQQQMARHGYMSYGHLPVDPKGVMLAGNVFDHKTIKDFLVRNTPDSWRPVGNGFGDISK